ncbi:MAG: aminotransferase class V-fold PLP-dependent enzyme [Acidobacteria bacterium]|nr:aminotransferase class V-fold PLP-dependent enzyme [Acidobacteriota bacterium]
MSLKSRWNRRSFLGTMGAATGSIFAPKGAQAEKKQKDEKHGVDGHAIVPITKGLGSTGDVYAELGVKPLVNIVGTVTVIGGSVMKPEVMELMRQGNQHFVMINDLEVAAGRYIEKLCKTPAGYTGLVTGGVAAAIVVAYAGMLTEDLEPRLSKVPDLTGFPKNEVIIQKAHRNPFDHQVRQTGVSLVEVETKDQMINAINPKTLAMHYINIQSNMGKVSGPEMIEIAKKAGIYTFNDASADVPPKERLWEYPAQGWDFVAFSGGKDICGPQSTGVLIGKEQLIRWAQMNMSPQEDRIGRACKVGKEQIFALLKALEMFVDQDYDAVVKSYDDRAAVISKAVEKFGVTAQPRQFNPNALGNVTPHYSWKIDQTKTSLTAQDVMKALAETKPVGIGSMNADSMGMRGRNPDAPARPPRQRRFQQDPTVFGFAMWQLKDGEDKYIADRLAEIFSSAKKA